MTQISLQTAGTGDVERLSDLIAEAMAPLDVTQWLVEDPTARRQIMPGYFALLTGHAVRHGTVSTATLSPPPGSDQSAPGRQVDAVAVWLTMPTEEIPSYGPRLRAACGRWSPRFVLLDQAMERLHPAGSPHAYLAFLAVRPQCQGKGLGTALLRSHHADLDRIRMPAYLEAGDSRSESLYARHGYAPCGPTLPLPVRGESLQPMWREPHPPGAA